VSLEGETGQVTLDAEGLVRRMERQGHHANPYSWYHPKRKDPAVIEGLWPCGEMLNVNRLTRETFRIGLMLRTARTV
jgi:hypothetical protein